MTPTKAEELAARLESGWCPIESPADMERAAAELRRLSAVEAERDALRADAERLDWIERAALARKVEIARSLLGTGFEIGQWPSMRVTVTSGSLRAAIDAAMKGTK